MSRFSYDRIILIAIAIISLILTLQAVSMMMFASLGQTPNSDRWGYVLTLQVVLGIIGITGYLSNVANFSSVIVKTSHFVLNTLCGVLLGFYYGGTYADNNSQVAVVSAIAVGIIFNLLYRWQKQIVSTVVMAIASVCAYGFASIGGIAAINLIAGSLFIPGIIWSCVCLVYLGLTVNNLAIAFKKIKDTRSLSNND